MEILLLAFMIFLVWATMMGGVVYFVKMLRSVQKLPPVTFTQPPEIFVIFPCKLCQTSIVVDQQLMPGEVAVQECPNCQISWTIYNRQLYIEQTKNLPEPLKSVVAEKLAQLNA